MSPLHPTLNRMGKTDSPIRCKHCNGLVSSRVVTPVHGYPEDPQYGKTVDVIYCPHCDEPPIR